MEELVAAMMDRWKDDQNKMVRGFESWMA